MTTIKASTKKAIESIVCKIEAVQDRYHPESIEYQDCREVIASLQATIEQLSKTKD